MINFTKLLAAIALLCALPDSASAQDLPDFPQSRFRMTNVVVRPDMKAIGYQFSNVVDTLGASGWSRIRITQYTFDPSVGFDPNNPGEGVRLELRRGSGYTTRVFSGGLFRFGQAIEKGQTANEYLINVKNLNTDPNVGHAFLASWNGLESIDGQFLEGATPRFAKFEQFFVYDELPIGGTELNHSKSNRSRAKSQSSWQFRFGTFHHCCTSSE